MPFGLTNAVATFQRAVSQTIEKEHLMNTLCYMDDVVVCGKTKEDYDIHLK